MGPTVYKLQININDWAATALAHSPAFSAEQWEEVHVSEEINMQERTDTHTHKQILVRGIPLKYNSVLEEIKHIQTPQKQIKYHLQHKTNLLSLLKE